MNVDNGWIELLRVAWLPALAIVIIVLVGNKANAKAQEAMNPMPLPVHFVGCGVMSLLNIVFGVAGCAFVLWLLVEMGWKVRP